MFPDWYLRAFSNDIDLMVAKFLEDTFGGPMRTIVFDFDDIQTLFFGSVASRPISFACSACKCLSVGPNYFL
jgi:hypothetical protein